jgi:hypothetical protein
VSDIVQRAQEFATRAVLLLCALLLLPATGMAKPSAREILAQTTFTSQNIQSVLDGKLVTSEVVEVSERELGGRGRVLGSA